VYLERAADLGEFLSFPAGKHDDEVDTASLIGRAIDQAHPAMIAPVQAVTRRDGYWPTDEGAADSWKTV
jgi:hypothetical protein